MITLRHAHSRLTQSRSAARRAILAAILILPLVGHAASSTPRVRIKLIVIAVLPFDCGQPRLPAVTWANDAEWAESQAYRRDVFTRAVKTVKTLSADTVFVFTPGQAGPCRSALKTAATRLGDRFIDVPESVVDVESPGFWRPEIAAGLVGDVRELFMAQGTSFIGASLPHAAIGRSLAAYIQRMAANRGLELADDVRIEIWAEPFEAGFARIGPTLAAAFGPGHEVRTRLQLSIPALNMLRNGRTETSGTMDPGGLGWSIVVLPDGDPAAIVCDSCAKPTESRALAIPDPFVTVRLAQVYIPDDVRGSYLWVSGYGHVESVLIEHGMLQAMVGGYNAPAIVFIDVGKIGRFGGHDSSLRELKAWLSDLVDGTR